MTSFLPVPAGSAAAGVLLLTCAAVAQPVEPSFERMWVAAQRERPATLSSHGRIAEPTEPGTPLVIRGQVLAEDGRTPVAGAVVFAYQTDARGVYDHPGRDGWRLKGWARTDAEGRFTFDTIRPAPYPGRQIAAHVHIGLDGPAGQRRLLPDLLFADDSLLSARERQRAGALGAFGNVRSTHRLGGREGVDIRYRLPGEFVF
jgi:protocatechuate 3,4-dioxygenase beta subunit